MSSNFAEHLERLRKTIPSLTPAELAHLRATNPAAVVIDIREAEELTVGIVPDSIHIPRSVLEIKVASLAPDQSTELVLYCAAGTRSLLACHNLRELGYTKLRSLDRGFQGWKSDGLPVSQPMMLDPTLRKRYARQVMLKEIGEQGQLRLSKARVTVIGAGGLGSPSLLYLAAAGIGHLRIVDFDSVELSNLHRQVIHNEERIGTGKARSAMLTLGRLNSSVRVEPVENRIDVSNVREILGTADLVIDGSDNFETRYAVSDYCTKNKVPLLFAGIFRFEAQLAYFSGQDGPCLRCLYPMEAPPELAPSCQDAGVLGAFVGTIGCIQAMEAIKILAGGTSAIATGEVLTLNGQSLKTSRLQFSKSPHCSIHRHVASTSQASR